MARTGATRLHYQTQKKQAYAYFRVNGSDDKKVALGQFTLFDFITNLFSYSPVKRDMAVKILEILKEEDLTFTELVEKMNAKKSSLYLLCLSLQRSGLIEKEEGKKTKFKLSSSFSNTLFSYSNWWQKWANKPI